MSLTPNLNPNLTWNSSPWSRPLRPAKFACEILVLVQHLQEHTRTCRDWLSSAVTRVCHISPQCWPWGVLMLPVVLWFHGTSSHAGSQRVIKTNTRLLRGKDLSAFPTWIISFSLLFEAKHFQHYSPSILKFSYKRQMFWPRSDPSHPWQLHTEGSHEKNITFQPTGGPWPLTPPVRRCISCLFIVVFVSQKYLNPVTDFRVWCKVPYLSDQYRTVGQTISRIYDLGIMEFSP